MKKISIGLAFLTALSINTYAQDDVSSSSKLQLGVKIGANYANVYDAQSEEFKSDALLGVAGGVFLSIPIGQYLGIQPEIMFSQKGYQTSGSLLGVSYNYKHTSNFIDIPLFFAFKPIPIVTLLVGPQYSLLISERRKFSNTLFDPIVKEDDFKNLDVRKNTLGVALGGDINIDRVVIGFRAGFDVLHNNGDGTQSTPRYKNAYYQGTIGLRF